MNRLSKNQFDCKTMTKLNTISVMVEHNLMECRKKLSNVSDD